MIFSERFSAVASKGFQSFFLMLRLTFGLFWEFVSASLKRLSAASSDSTISSASSGQESALGCHRRGRRRWLCRSRVDGDSSVVAGLNAPVAAFTFRFVND